MKIVQAKRGGKNRVEIVFDDGEIITLAYEIYLKNNLKLNQEVSEQILSNLLSEDQKYQVKQSALNYISRRHHSKSEIRVKLKQKKFDPIHIEQVLSELEQHSYIDDAAFARIFTDERVKTKNWGKNKVKAELIKRGVPSKIIEEIIREKFSDHSELEAGFELAQRKFKVLSKRNLGHKKIQVSIYSFLVSRGYDYDSCKQIVGKLFRGEELTDF
jgi:regulatory protein